MRFGIDIIHTTVSGGVLILAIIFIRSLALHKLPKVTFSALWGITALRLLIPVQIKCRFSIYSVLQPWFSNNAETVIPHAGLISHTGNFQLTAGTGTAVVRPAPPSPISVWTVIWLAGAGVVATVLIISYIRCQRDFRRSLPVDNDAITHLLQIHPIHRQIRVCCSDGIITPLTYGILRPTILLPEATDWSDSEQLAYIITHEVIHIRRFDGLLKLFLSAAVCVHWFNPFVWAMMILANRDIEMSCDEAVVRTLGDNTKSAYALALISMEERKRILSPIVSHFNKTAIEERITAIMKIKRTSIFSIILALAVVFGTVTVFATSASAADAEQAAGTTVEDDAAMTKIAIARLAEDHPKTAEWIQNCYPDAVWWTYEGYKAAAEQYLQGLKDDLGEVVGYDRDGNPLVVTEEWIEEDTTYTEDTLQKLQDGIMIPKFIDGDGKHYTEIDPAEVESWSGRAIECTVGLLDGTEKHFGPYDTMDQFRAVVEPFCQEQLAAGNLSQEDMDEISEFMSDVD